MPYKDKEKRRERAKLRRKEHLAAGLCEKCNKPSAISVYCMYHWYLHSLYKKRSDMKHAEEERIYQRERFQRLLAEGRCRSCGVVKVEGEGVFCVNCRNTTVEGVLKYETAD